MHTHYHAPQPVTFEDCIKFHGHSCPGLAFGYRAAITAMEALGVTRPEDEELVAICETNACGIDAIQVVAGTTAGKGNLIVHDYGKHVFTFFNRKNKKSVRICINTHDATEREDFAQLREKVFGGKATKEEEAAFDKVKQDVTNHVLTAPLKSVLDMQEVQIDSPKEARIFASITCECCGEAVADAKTRKVKGKCVCIPCAEGKPFSKKK